MTKRASTVSAPLDFGQTHTTKIWTHDHAFHASDVVINLSSWPGLAKGDVIQVTRNGADVVPGASFMFLVSDDTIAGPKSTVPHLSILRDLANKFDLGQNMDVMLTKVDPSRASASVVEVYFRDMYLGRRDMWLMISHITGSPVYTGQKINFFSSQGAVIKKIYIDGRQVQSAVMTPKTRTVFRSLSARSNIFISVCRELWEFLETGERYYEKIVHSFLPALISKWRDSSVKHVVAIVLFSRVYYDQSELDYAAGPLVKDEDGNWYKDFYKVVVDLEILKDWRPVLVTLKQSFLEFQRDILFNHHYHQNRQRIELQNESDHSLQRLVGHLSYAHDAPILEAINLGLNPTDLHYVDRSLALTGCSTIIVTPGPGRFRVDKNLLQFTTMRLLDQGFGVDLVSLTRAPLHVAPIFTFKSEDPDLLVKDSRQDLHFPSYGSFEMDPLWSTNEKKVPYDKKDYHWEPFWMQVSWWDVQADMPFRPDRFVPRAKMHEIQTIGLLDHDMIASIEVPFTKDPARDLPGHTSLAREARRMAREEFDRSVFAAVLPATEEKQVMRLEDTTPKAVDVQPNFNHDPPAQPPASPRIVIDRPRPRHTPRRPSEALLDAEVVSRPAVVKETAQPDGDRESRSQQRDNESPFKRRSSSRDSVRSTASTSSTRPKSSLASRFPGSAWLFGSLRSNSMQSTSHVEAISEKDEPARSEAARGSSEHRDQTASSMLSSIQRSASFNSIPSSDPIAIPQPTTSQRPPSELDPDPVAAVVPRVPRISPFHIMNPTRPITLSRTNSVLARCWQHAFHRPTFTSEIKWTSMCAPACLPLTTEHYTSEADLLRDYVDYTFDVYITEAVHGSFLLRRDPKGETDWARLVMREMIAARLVQGFQLIVRADDNKEVFDPNQETLAKMIPGSFPVGVADVLPTTSHPIYLSIGSQLHRLLYEPIENVIRVSRFVRRNTKRSVKTIDYACLVWPKLGQGYTEASTSFSLPDFDAYGWNRLDRTITGYQRDFGDLVRYWRTRYLVIPSEEPPMERNAEHGNRERLSDEECRLLGITRLALLFHQSRWMDPVETKETYSLTQFLPTTLDPPACVLDEDLMAQLDELNATAATGQHRISDLDIEGISLVTLAQMMRDEPGLIQDNQWHGNLYKDTFTGRQWVSWIVRAFRDISTREEAEDRGVQLCRDGFFLHIRRDHGFMDGHYYYRLSDQYAGPSRRPRRGSRWFSGSRSTSKEGNTLSDLSSSVTSLSGPPTGGLKPRKKHSLSQTMILHADYRKRSTQAENLILHHDVIQNPGTAFHFEFNWIGTAGRCIDDLLKYWSHIITPYGLKLVEGYVDPIIDITKKNIFQSCFPIPLAVAPPSIPDIRERLPIGSSSEWYFEYAILRKFGYILDIEAEQSYSDAVDVNYSYRRASFRQSQFVHQSGRAFVQVMGGREGFYWVTNRLLAASTAFPVGGPDARNEATPHEKAAELRLDLLAFCSDAGRLERFYKEVIDTLPPLIHVGFDLDDDEELA